VADEKTWKGGRLGPFNIGRRYRNVGVDLGRIYAAENVHSGAPALVVVPGARADWEPKESWRVCVSSHAEPPYVTLVVEHAPASGRLPELADMLDLVTSAVERLEKNDEARAHLTGGPVGAWKRWMGRVRRLPRSRRALPVAGLAAVLALGAVLWPRFSEDLESPKEKESASDGATEQAAAQTMAPVLADTTPGATAIAYPLPAKPFSDQAKAPCYPKKGEVEINGGCWLELAKRPPCYDDHAEYQGKCYVPVSARSHQGEPRSLQP
jgi:hypothetical protein